MYFYPSNKDLYDPDKIYICGMAVRRFFSDEVVFSDAKLFLEKSIDFLTLLSKELFKVEVPKLNIFEVDDIKSQKLAYSLLKLQGGFYHNGKIVLAFKGFVTLLRLLHEFAHHLQDFDKGIYRYDRNQKLAEAEANSWAVTVLFIAFPKQVKKLHEVNGLPQTGRFLPPVALWSDVPEFEEAISNVREWKSEYGEDAEEMLEKLFPPEDASEKDESLKDESLKEDEEEDEEDEDEPEDEDEGGEDEEG